LDIEDWSEIIQDREGYRAVMVMVKPLGEL